MNFYEHLNESEIEFLGSESFKLTNCEFKMIMEKKNARNQLLFAVMLQHYKIKRVFPERHNSLVTWLTKIMADEIKTEICYFHELDTNHRTIKRFRQVIREMFGYREATDTDSILLINWLVNEHLNKMPHESETGVAIAAYYQKAKIEPFSIKQQERYLDAARRKFETEFFYKIIGNMTNENKTFIDFLLEEAKEDIVNGKPDLKAINLNTLKKEIQGAKLKNVQFALEKYEAIRIFHLPDNIITGLSRKILLKYYDRIMAYSICHIKELDEDAKYAMIAIFCHIRGELLADGLGNLLSKLVNKLKKSSENYVDKTVKKELKRVEGKLDILLKLTNASLSHPEGVIKDTIYPVVGVETLERVREDLNQRGNWYKKQVRNKMRSLYAHGSRPELIHLISFLDFNACEEDGKAVLEAVNFIIKNKDTMGDFYESDIEFPLEVIPQDCFDFVIEWNPISINPKQIAMISVNSMAKYGAISDTLSLCCLFLSKYLVELKAGSRSLMLVNKLNYGMVILNELVDKLYYKGIWIEGSYRYRDPRRDLPPDFEENKKKYYEELGLPMDVEEFIKPLKNELAAGLSSLNASILTNDKVSISSKNGGHIKISPSIAQAAPENLIALQNEIIKRWGYINLIDAFKETNIRIEFTSHMETVGKYSILDTEKLILRLLLSLYAIGSNTGLKRISVANPDANEQDLHYVKRRYINPTNVKLAIRKVVNAVISIRDPAIFGTGTTTVACDSKKLNAWDQNLMNEWHGRYRGHGIMVYWHVDTNALCIHAQSKTCTSSEVGAMLKGILEHGSKMEMDSVYIDTHGQSVIGFGTGRLLKVDLFPRLKNIHKQKLYIVSDSDRESYENIATILKGSINWKHIEKYYDEVVRYMVALKTGLVESDVFVKRFSRDNYKHPVYKALCEIGKAAKTIFLCNYLQDEEFRIEINAGLNIVERLNSVMNFFFYGKLGEINSNDPEEQELSILCLHLLQACSVYINTLLIQEILSEPAWKNRLTKEDYRALSPLIHAHFNPYGIFLLDLAKRLIIGIEDLQHDKTNSNTSQRKSEAVNQVA